ncbi:transporter substrate-binding domain-containing protein [Shinella kummerowiae]|jgi:polar amino acid transport system substrate-binding protein|uniref:Transporter substrate-binding domain-containing protein n=1 Tax=Shinella kummerowiae TaxID=417745 RepID=A0A6N8SJM5_9HYPH|nr:transporter substrate-binding domain-containing protein [Shinella kummerowiae]MCT7667744.1 transporter substrate-binding domain-containing protein [Shinella kummerowiae]MXN49254.1 transporter substrate-binding domain-containing protein [Shinella kummerowiae]
MVTAVTRVNAPKSRRKWQLASLVSLACAIGATAIPAKADQLEKVKERGKLVVGIKTDYPPFGYLGADGQVKGFEIDIAKFVAKELLGSADAIELVPVVASNRIELLNAGRIDAIFATLGTNPDRAKIIDFTHEYYQMEGMVLLTSKDSAITAWEEVKGKKLCGIQGNLYNRTLTEKFGAETVLFAGTAEMFKAFQDNRCEGIAFDGPILNMKVAEDGWKDKYKIAVGAFAFNPIAGGVRKGEVAFLEAVNKAITDAEAKGVLVASEKTFNMGASEYVAKRAEEAKAKAN